MKQCPICLTEVNDNLTTCPKCGHVFDAVHSDNLDHVSDNANDTKESMNNKETASTNTLGFEEQRDQSKQSVDWKHVFIQIVKGIKSTFLDFIQLIIHPDAHLALSLRSLLVFVIIEIVSTFMLMAAFGNSLYRYFLRPLIAILGYNNLWIHQFQMSWVIPFIASIALVMINALVYTLTLLIGHQKVSATLVVSHLLVPSLALLFAALTLNFLLPYHVNFIYLAIGFVMFWMISTLMHVVDDLKINNFYLRILILSIVAIILVSVIGMCFQYLMGAMLQINTAVPSGFSI